MSQIDAPTSRLLETLTHAIGARRVLEIGTGSGDSAISIGRALPEDGMLITLERDEARAIRARARLDEEGLARRVSVMIGDANRYLHKIAGPFDLVVQHVDSAQRPALRPRLLQLLRAGGLLATSIATDDGELVLTVKR